jgi:hypothetical protein
MGWDVTQVGANITTKKFIEHYIRRTYDGIYEAVKIFEGKNVEGQKAFYVALRKLETGAIFACVFLTKRKNGQVAVKVMGEDEEPFYYEAPQSFIDVLTPPKTMTGAWWRWRCLEKYQELADA